MTFQAVIKAVHQQYKCTSSHTQLYNGIVDDSAVHIKHVSTI